VVFLVLQMNNGPDEYVPGIWLYFIINFSCVLSENNTSHVIVVHSTQRPVMVSPIDLTQSSKAHSPRLMRPSLDKQPCGWTLVTKIGSSPLLLPRPPATVMPSDSWGSFFTVICFSLQLTHWERSWKTLVYKINIYKIKAPPLDLLFFHQLHHWSAISVAWTLLS